MNRTLLASLGAACLAALMASGGTASAARPPRVRAGATACNVKSLPLAVGNTWTYKSGAQTVVIKVLEIGPGKDYAGRSTTLATLEEDFNGRKLNTVFSCGPGGGLLVPLESFFFTGEPGGGVFTSFNVTSRDQVSWLVDDQVITDQGWVEQVKADVTREDAGGAGAVHAPAKLEVERHVNVKAPEKLMIGLGEFNPQKVIFELRGRGIIGEEKIEIAIKRPGTVWLQKGIGFLKVEDAFDKSWELVDTNLIAK